MNKNLYGLAFFLKYSCVYSSFLSTSAVVWNCLNNTCSCCLQGRLIFEFVLFIFIISLIKHSHCAQLILKYFKLFLTCVIWECFALVHFELWKYVRNVDCLETRKPETFQSKICVTSKTCNLNIGTIIYILIYFSCSNYFQSYIL